MGFSKISLGSITKSYPHNLSFDNNTSLPFGVVQPLLSIPMSGDSSIEINWRQLLRLAPMPLPTFGRVSLRGEAFFVPTSEVCPYYEALLAHQPYRSSQNTEFEPESVPLVNSTMFVYAMMCNYSRFSVLVTPKSSEDGMYTYLSSSEVNSKIATLRSAMYKNIAGFQEQPSQDFEGSFNLLFKNHHVSDKKTFEITPYNCDFILYAEDSTNLYVVLFQLTDAGRRLRTNLLGLGYSLGVDDADSVSLLPALAFYKAYFDFYAPKEVATWSSTQCYGLIRHIDDTYSFDFTITNLFKNGDRYNVGLFDGFLDELTDTWYVSPVDYVSANRSEIFSQERSVVINSTTDDAPDKLLNSSPNGSSDNVPDANQVNYLTQFILDALKRLTSFLSKDSVIGGKLNDWLRVHYGASVSNSLFALSNHVTSFVVDANISDVYSTSDTANEETETGEYLGAYGGKGLGFNKHGLKFKTDVSGFIFVFAAIVPDAGYWQGNDPTLFAVNRDTIPVPDYDALGYELTPRSSLFVNSLVSDGTPFKGKSFGYLPRYSGFKYHKNVVNGDMSRNGTIQSLSAFYLDRILTQKVVTFIPEGDGKYSFSTYKGSDIPDAGSAWRYICRYSWLGDFNRLFYNRGYTNQADIENGAYAPIDDNFYLQTVFDVTLRNHLKPIEYSYDTILDTVDNSTTTVRNN